MLYMVSLQLVKNVTLQGTGYLSISEESRCSFWYLSAPERTVIFLGGEEERETHKKWRIWLKKAVLQVPGC